ncbi:zinc finger BED domain-containing protein RICESLEEPER 2-like [Canna indica]|uniref:Zinc finger BED domain-containing protein RICESLEEPER 2-like n=1 Tax=Canna indica TaxID=4628 RepID=A0AAQ3KYJ7_9LILI|nr:zinc finger BED domain-containing protein RICESLEEPER 2-like [Canna indica]
MSSSGRRAISPRMSLFKYFAGKAPIIPGEARSTVESLCTNVGVVLLGDDTNTTPGPQSEAGENSAIVNSSQEAPDEGQRNSTDTTETTMNGDTDPPEKKKRKTSKVWNEFTVVSLKDGIKKNQCNYCRTRLAYQNTGSTTHLNRHMLTCAVRLASISGKTQQVLALPTMEHDGKIEFLEVFNEATNVFSGYEYPTANLFLPEVWKIKQLLELTVVDDCEYMKAMTFKMKDKFDKYWGECNLLMIIASILDPRYKMQLVIFCFSKIYLNEFEAKMKIDVVKDAIYDLYNYYVEMHESQQPSQTNMDSGPSGSSNNPSLLEKNKTKSRSEFDMWAQSVDSITPSKSDLDAYLEEGRYICTNGESFDVLQWWKTNTLKFKILSKMAKDVLSIPVTTVASESTFSAGGRVLDQYRSSLKPEIVQALICTTDWLKNDYKIIDYTGEEENLET